MVNTQFAVWLRRNAGTKKETSTATLYGKFFKHSDAHTPLFPQHVGFKYLHCNYPPRSHLKMVRDQKSVLKVNIGKICYLKVSQ